MCQAVLNTFACYHVDDGGGLYADNQLVRRCQRHSAILYTLDTLTDTLECCCCFDNGTPQAAQH